MLFTVYAGAIPGPAAQQTDDPALALHWARNSGPYAYVTVPAKPGTKKTEDIVWTVPMDNWCRSVLHEAIVSRAVSAAVLG